MSFYLQKHQGLRFHAEYSLHRGQFHLWARKYQGATVEAVRLETDPANDMGGGLEEPTMQMSVDEVQSLMDSLWSAGVRPSDMRGHRDLGPVIEAKDEVIAAKDEHIGDLRKVSFDSGE